MKKYFPLLILALAIVFSCTKEQGAKDEDLVQLVFTGITEDTKTSLESDFTITWSTEDDITVFPGASAAGVKFDVSKTSEDGHHATFSGSAAASDTYYALSPAQDGASISGGVITATLPTTQAAVSGSFAPEANISVATASDYVFQFKNVGALVGITIGNDDITGVNDDITGVKLEALGGEVLTGTAVIDPADGSLQSKSGESYAQLSGSFTKGDTYYFIVLPGTYSGGFRITLYKGAQYTRFTKSAEKTIGRNDNLDLGSYTGTNWKTAFYVGEGVKIKGSAEDGQYLAYVGSNGYWNPDIQYSDVNDYPYNYEIFTRLTQGQKFYFEADGGEKFALNAGGNAIEPLTKIANAPYGAPSDGLYRIRMVLPNGAAEIKQISEVKYDIYGLDSRALSYDGNGTWKSDNFWMRTDSYMNRYRFIVKFTDNTKQYYGRMSTETGNPIYDITSADYFYVQPTIDSDADHWSPCFRYQFETSDDRYYCTMTLSLNNDNGHYTHSVTNMRDNNSQGDIVYICGSNEAGQQMYLISSGYYNIEMADFGDNSNIATTPGDYYEIFTRINSGEVFYFYNATTGKYYAPNADGSAVVEISGPSNATYSIQNSGVWRIRANFNDSRANIRRIDQVRTELNYDSGADGAVHQLSYNGKGTWKKENAVIKGDPGKYGRTLFVEYVVKLWFNKDNADNTIDYWQVYGSTSVKSGSPDSNDDGSYWNVQPATGDNWSHVFFYPSWTVDESNNGRYTATITLYMDNTYGHYTHRFTDVTDTH